MPAAASGRVLSVQSHVVSGYVGNKNAVFALNRLGFEVDALNTTQLSNHTGFPEVTGQRLGGADVRALWDGMKAAWGSVTGWLGGLGGQIAGLKGPIEKDRVLLNPIGEAIIDGLENGMKRRWVGVQQTLGRMTDSIAVSASLGTTAGALVAGGSGPGSSYVEYNFIAAADRDQALARVPDPAKRAEAAAFLEGRI